MPRRRRGPAGFTLIEVCLIILILAILAAILFPLFAKPRFPDGRPSCMSNMKQLGLAFLMYAQDNDEALPGNGGVDRGIGKPLGFLDPGAGRNWAEAILPYVKIMGPFRCPEAQPHSTGEQRNAALDETLAEGGGNTSYLFNGIAEGKPRSAISEPSRLIVLHEQHYYGRAALLRPDRSGSVYRHFNDPLYDKGHGEGGNLAFADGHIKWQQKTRIRFVQFGAAAPEAASFDAEGTNEGTYRADLPHPF